MAADTGANLSDDLDPLPIPPMDPLFLSTSTSDDLCFDLDDNCDFELTFDDLDNLYFPSESEAFILPSETITDSPESGCSGISGNHTLLDVDTFFNSSSPQISNSNSNSNSNNGNDCDREFSGGPSDNCGSGVLSAPSPDSGNFVVDQKIKVESVSKRKKENEETNSESRSIKYRKSSPANEDANDNVSEEDMKKKARLMRNRESAQLSRQRKKHYVEELEEKVRTLHSTIADLNNKISYFMAENATLRQQLSGGNAMRPPPPPPPHMGMYSHPHMAPAPYPWMPCATTPYMVKPNGSQVPLVPIPRLKPQQSGSASKAKKSDASKTKKVASVSFLGLFIFMMLFGGLVPFVNVKYGGMGDAVSGGYFNNRFYDQQRGRVLAVNGHSNGTRDMAFGISKEKIDISDKIHCERGIGNKEKGSQSSPGADEFVRLGNASEPLVASLYVPRNDKLVKIDGNLIIHSVLASEKTIASHEVPQMNDNNNRETGLAIPKDFTPALAIPDVRANSGRHSHLYRKPTERQKALSSGSADALKDHMKSTAADGKLQQWFREGLAARFSGSRLLALSQCFGATRLLASSIRCSVLPLKCRGNNHYGYHLCTVSRFFLVAVMDFNLQEWPLLSSGTCTEVFHFDASPASAAGAIIPASSVANISVEHRKNVTHVNKGRNRRILHSLPVPFTGSDQNVTGEHVKRNSQKNSFEGNESASSMIVSVLVDPREAGEDVDGMITPKSLSRIFVVVLLDSVKYVTYSCGLPRSGPHLVTT
ncbi:hypothetical protein JRO89_XS11G0051300 [Xanthoceras sorbifolium]|uniref:BZIP domain-containing protein n=1 Tax=Xanthoceras sorbifolium TaxID=99658 RepID=A0ABQ8HES4_9ROSI|nr:hypothetical protein JRO89_XS11G0051300 [Xanthoceras sorbifolium]